MEAALYSELCTDLVPFEAILSESNQVESLEDIKVLQEMGEDPSGAIRSLVENLDSTQLQACYDLCKKDEAIYTQERTGIISFLDTLKSAGTIKEYRTFPSTTEANDFNVQDAGMDDGAILWLIDRNFLRVGESTEAGLNLAENLVKRVTGGENYIYILSAVESDSEKNEDVKFVVLGNKKLKLYDL